VAIHHLAFDRNLLGIDPEGVVHIAGHVLREIDGPMLRTGLEASTARRSQSRGGARTVPIRAVSRLGSSASHARLREQRYRVGIKVVSLRPWR